MVPPRSLAAMAALIQPSVVVAPSPPGRCAFKSPAGNAVQLEERTAQIDDTFLEDVAVRTDAYFGASALKGIPRDVIRAA